jgi:hypothetical protein
MRMRIERDLRDRRGTSVAKCILGIRSSRIRCRRRKVWQPMICGACKESGVTLGHVRACFAAPRPVLRTHEIPGPKPTALLRCPSCQNTGMNFEHIESCPDIAPTSTAKVLIRCPKCQKRGMTSAHIGSCTGFTAPPKQSKRKSGFLVCRKCGTRGVTDQHMNLCKGTPVGGWDPPAKRVWISPPSPPGQPTRPRARYCPSCGIREEACRC